jgi:hypothetical protein
MQNLLSKEAARLIIQKISGYILNSKAWLIDDSQYARIKKSVLHTFVAVSYGRRTTHPPGFANLRS